MGSADFSPELCEQPHAVPKKLASRISWQRGDGRNSLIFKATVLAPDGIALELTGHWQKNGRHNRTCWGFSLVYLGHCVRSFDMAKYHRNPGGNGKIRGPHKHKYSSSKISRLAYSPNPPICDTDPNRSLLDFLQEANIDQPINYQYFLFP
jgi:hypothetical protein